MLDKQVFKEGMEKLMYLFSSWNFDPRDSKQRNVWYGQFRHMDNKRFEHMIDSYIKNEKFNPTIKTLLDNDTIHRKSKEQKKHEAMLKEQERLLEKEMSHHA